MIMRIHSDASYQSETESLSRADGLLIFGITQLQRHQRKQRCRSHYLWNHQKRYVGGFWRWMRIHLYQLQAHSPTTDHTQGNGTPTSANLVQIDNYTTEVIMNSTMQQKRSNAMDMHFYWVQDCMKQKQFNVCWKPGSKMFGDYHTKHYTHPSL